MPEDLRSTDHGPGHASRGRSGTSARRGALDPADWEAFRDTCRRAVDEIVDRYRGTGQGPVWREMPAEVRETFRDPLPRAARPVESVLDQVGESLLPYTLGNTDPRFFGWVHGAGTPAGALAELVSGAMNANLGGRHHAPILVEEQVVSWVREMLGFPEGATGLLVSGTSMATITGLAVARHRVTGGRDRKEGLPPAGTLVGYASADGHQSIRDAFSLLGLGGDALRSVPTGPDGAMDPDALEDAVRADVEAGLTPFAVVATAGSVTCGAIDDLERIAGTADRHDLWMHVDGAFGAALRLSPSLAPRLAGIELADSVAFDFHKWFHVPYDAGCVLVRDGDLHRSAFGGREDYLTSLPSGPASGEVWPCDLGPELSRGFRAFKVWFALQTLGADAIGAAVEENCRQAGALAARVDREPELQRLAPADLNIVCFRYVPPGMSRSADGTAVDELNELNRDILLELHTRGLAVPSPIRRDDAFGLRVCLCNHRTSHEDLRALVENVLEIGRELTPAGVAGAEGPDSERL